jgi:branched-subunit amino acid transport protein
MSDPTIWIVIVGLTAVTLVTRSVFLVLGDRFPLPERVQHGLRYAPACALMALVAPELVVTQGAIDVSLGNPRLIAGIVAATTILATRSMIAAMVIGMAAFTLLRLLA